MVELQGKFQGDCRIFGTFVPRCLYLYVLPRHFHALLTRNALQQ